MKNKYKIFGFVVDFCTMNIYNSGSILVLLKFEDNMWHYKVDGDECFCTLDHEWQTELNNCYKQWLTEKILLGGE